jgi:hypothetical protein
MILAFHITLTSNKMKIKKPKQIPHCRNNSKIDTPNTQIHDRSLSWLRIGIAIKSDGLKLVL